MECGVDGPACPLKCRCPAVDFLVERPCPVFPVTLTACGGDERSAVLRFHSPFALLSFVGDGDAEAVFEKPPSPLMVKMSPCRLSRSPVVARVGVPTPPPAKRSYCVAWSRTTLFLERVPVESVLPSLK